MARQCGLGVTHFIHHSKQITNTTPILHLNQCRLEAAARLLRKNPLRNVTDVALDCGFASSQYFATLFRRQFGRTPRDYRNAGENV
jgi:AraC family L-rhamnose operon regulatory protein RhaS